MLVDVRRNVAKRPMCVNVTNDSSCLRPRYICSKCVKYVLWFACRFLCEWLSRLTTMKKTCNNNSICYMFEHLLETKPAPLFPTNWNIRMRIKWYRLGIETFRINFEHIFRRTTKYAFNIWAFRLNAKSITNMDRCRNIFMGVFFHLLRYWSTHLTNSDRLTVLFVFKNMFSCCARLITFNFYYRSTTNHQTNQTEFRWLTCGPSCGFSARSSGFEAMKIIVCRQKHFSLSKNQCFTYKKASADEWKWRKIWHIASCISLFFSLKKTRLIDLRNECNLNKTRLSFLINWGAFCKFWVVNSFAPTPSNSFPLIKRTIANFIRL